jgi:hypothetical protein
MKASAWSIRNLLVVILVLCADFYLIRDSFDLNFRYPYFGWPEAFQYGFLGSLPMTNLVVIGGSVILSKGGKRRAFLAGFVLAGAVGIAACLALSLAIPSEWSGFLDPSNPRVTIWMRRHALLDSFDSQSAIVLRLAIATALFTIPEVLIALAGGYAACSLAWARDWDPRATTWRLPGGTIGLGRSEAGTEEAAMSQKTIHERDDVKPERGEHDYGRVRRPGQQEVSDRHRRARPRRLELYPPRRQRGEVSQGRGRDDQIADQTGREAAGRRDPGRLIDR